MLVREEQFTPELFKELLPILETHRLELSAYPDMELGVDVDAYYTLQQLNKLLVFVCRDKKSNVIGYTCFVVNTNPHYKEYKYAHQDVFYVVKDARGRKVARELIKVSEEVCKSVNVDVVVHHAKFTNTFGRFLELNGYTPTETTYHKRLSKSNKEPKSLKEGQS